MSYRAKRRRERTIPPENSVRIEPVEYGRTCRLGCLQHVRDYVRAVPSCATNGVRKVKVLFIPWKTVQHQHQLRPHGLPDNQMAELVCSSWMVSALMEQPKTY